MNFMNIEKFIPHRNQMKLVDEIIEVDVETAVTGAVVTEQWPLFRDGYTDPAVLIELVAQTAGICRGWQEISRNPEKAVPRGWIVGIKKAKFFVSRIPLNTRIITRSENRVTFDNYLEIYGTSEIASELAGELILQVYGSEGIKG